MKTVVFEDEGWEGLLPVTLLRHTSQLVRGTKTLLAALLESVTDSTDNGLWGRDMVEETAGDGAGRGYNRPVEETALMVNALAKPGPKLLSLTSRRTPFVAVSGGRVVAARVDVSGLAPGVLTRKKAAWLKGKGDRLELPAESIFEGYWDLVESNGLAIAEQAKGTHDPLALPSSVEVKGPPTNLQIDGGAEVERLVSFDTRLGPVIVEKGASIESFSRVMGPCYIGPRTKIHSGLIGGGTSIFEVCKVGGQVENSIIGPHSNKAHHGYVGDSYVGEWVNLGAGCTFSNLKNTYGNVRVMEGNTKHDTGMVKLGPLIGDMSKISIGALVYSGRKVGTGSHVSGLARVDVPSFTSHDGGTGKSLELRVDTVVETQRRMMERRGMVMSRGFEGLLRRCFKATAPERRKSKVRKGTLS